MTVVTRRCDTEIAKAQTALQQTRNKLNSAQASVDSSKQILAAARARLVAAMKVHSSANTAQANQKHRCMHATFK
jgi:exonuclease VII small subunit